MKLETKNFELETGSKKKRWLQNILVAAVIVIVAVAVATRGQSGFFRFLLGERVPFPGLQKDGSYVLSNFEHDQDIRLWKLVDAKMMPHMDRSSNGLRSAKVTFRGLSDYSGIVLEDLIKTHKGISDWTSFESLDLDLFNEAKDPQTVMLVVSDLWGKHYQRPVTLPPDRWQAVSIPVKTIAASLNIQQVNQISFSMNRLRQDQAIDVDEIRLTPTPDARAALAKQAKTKHAVNMLDYGFAKLKPAWSGEDRATKTPIVRVPFVVKNETPGFAWKGEVQGGVPFPQGELRSLRNLRLRNNAEEDLPFQPRVLSRWPDGSVQWAALHFLATFQPGEDLGFFLDYGPTIEAIDYGPGITIEEDAQTIAVNTGLLEAVLDKKSFFLFDKVSVDSNGDGIYSGNETLTSGASLYLGFRGKEYRADLDTKTYRLEVEEKGRQRVVLKASGWFQSADGHRYCQVVVRYYFYFGKTDVKIAHTLIYTGYPENKQFGPYQMMRLPENETIEDFGIRMPLTFKNPGSVQLTIGRVEMEPDRGIPTSEMIIYQRDYLSATVHTGNRNTPVEKLLEGWFDISDMTRGVTVALRNFRENYPKAFKYRPEDNALQIDLWPEEAGELSLATTAEAKGPDAFGRGSAFGVGKTHELIFYFHPYDADKAKARPLAQSFMEPLQIRVNPYWIDATGAAGRLYPVTKANATAEKILDKLFDWADRQPQNFQWYGMLDFGDTLTWWRDQDDEKKYSQPGWYPVGRWGWYNCEGVGTHTGALLQFLRSGFYKYFKFGENLARHIMDVDTIHYDTITNDKRLKAMHPKYSQVGAMHRHNGNHWGGRTDESSHTSVVGLLLYHFITGDERARDVANEVGEFFLTEPFTYVGYPYVPNIAPQRAMANALWGDVLLYQTTGDERYKKAADKLIEIFLKGQNADGSFQENYNPMLKTWSGPKAPLYMTGYDTGAFIAYHALTQEPEVFEMLSRMLNYLNGAPEAIHGYAYAYLVTRDPKYLAMAEKGFQEISANHKQTSNPLTDGLIYAKPIYHRPMTFLATVPYLFGALAESDAAAADGRKA